MEINSYLPLQEPTFWILLSLSPGKKHGYAILKDVKTLSNGSLTMSTGTLYGAIERLMEQQLIERADNSEIATSSLPETQLHPGKPRKAYQLTTNGRLVLEAEILRLKALVTVAQGRLGDELLQTGGEG
jgi:DNA-binding PadR family transcriptional regulator